MRDKHSMMSYIKKCEFQFKFHFEYEELYPKFQAYGTNPQNQIPLRTLWVRPKHGEKA